MFIGSSSDSEGIRNPRGTGKPRGKMSLPTLAIETRRGTGFYKVLSLRGVCYRNAFGHGGQAETLEEWFDPARLNDDYVPKGFHMGPGPIKGHEFGLKLAADDRQALIAFLRSL